MIPPKSSEIRRHWHFSGSRFSMMGKCYYKAKTTQKKMTIQICDTLTNRNVSLLKKRHLL